MEIRRKWKPPSREEWKALYQAAISFRKLECWNYMQIDDIFGIEDPLSGEIAFCTILGSEEEYFGLAAYMGHGGLFLLNYLISGTEKALEETDIYEGRNLICSFEPWDNLLIEEQIQAESFNPKLREDPLCPGFISYEPGYIPYSLSQEECQLMTKILAQTLPIARKLKQDPQYLRSGPRDQILVRRVYSKNQHNTPLWKNVWKPFPAFFPLYPVIHIHDPQIKKRLYHYPIEEGMEWEIDFHLMPFVVEEGYKPYYPRTLFIADRLTGLVMEPAICNDIEAPEKKLLQHLIKLIDQQSSRPSAIYVKNISTHHLMSMVSSELGIQLIRTSSLPILDEAKKALLKTISRYRSSMVH